ncbi:MAG: hypothetical protein PHE97_05665, partial [Candidatus Omnitrophica bacterium]|nr:hypothetical protein [Candidatus Omnitrophota bacterium]
MDTIKSPSGAAPLGQIVDNSLLRHYCCFGNSAMPEISCYLYQQDALDTIKSPSGAAPLGQIVDNSLLRHYCCFGNSAMPEISC